MARLISAVSLFLLAAGLVPAAPIPKAPPEPLPKGAIARLGSLTVSGSNLHALTFSADGKQLLLPTRGELRSWDADTGKALPAKPLFPPGSGLRSDNHAITANRLFTLEYQAATPIRTTTTVVVTELADGSEVCRIPCDSQLNFAAYAFPSQLQSAAVTPDGKYLCVISQLEKAAEVYEVATGKRLHSRKLADAFGAGVHPSPDSKVLYVRESRKPIRRTELVTGKALPDLAGTDGLTNLVEASPDGKWVVTRGSVLEKDATGQVVSVVNQHFLTVHDAAANKVLGRLDLGANPGHFAFVAPDALVVLAMKVRPPGPFIETLSRWDLKTMKREWEVPAPSAGRLIVAPGGERFAAFNPVGLVHVFESKTGKRALTPTGHTGPVAWVGFTHGGERVTTAGGFEVISWTLKGERKALATPPEIRDGWVQPTLLGDRLAWVAFTTDGKTADLVGWDHEKGAIGWRMPLGADIPERLYSHDGRRVVGAWPDNKTKKVRAAVYDGPAANVLYQWEVLGAAYRGEYSLPPLALTGDGRLLFVGGNGVAGVDVTTGNEVLRSNIGMVEPGSGRAMSPLAVSADGGRIALVDTRAMRIFDVRSGKALAEYDGGRMYGATPKFSPDGKRVAVWNRRENTVLVCDAKSNAKPQTLDGGSSRPMCVTFSPDSSKLAVGYQDGTALIWDLAAK